MTGGYITICECVFAYLKTIKVLRRDKFGDIVGHALNQEKYLRVFLTDDEVPIDNNTSERASVALVLKRKTGR